MPVNKTGWILLVSGIRDYDEPTDAGALGTGKCIFKCECVGIGIQNDLKSHRP